MNSLSDLWDYLYGSVEDDSWDGTALIDAKTAVDALYAETGVRYTFAAGAEPDGGIQ